MRKIKIEDAVGMVLGHDVTQIIPGKYKGPRFKRGHKIRKEDISEFLKIGKEHVFVMELKPGIIHEDDAALRLGKTFSGKNIKTTGPFQKGRLRRLKIGVKNTGRLLKFFLIGNSMLELSSQEMKSSMVGSKTDLTIAWAKRSQILAPR
jgi:hypothetical protein